MLWYLAGACLLVPAAALLALEHRSRCRYKVAVLRGHRPDKARLVLLKSWLLYLVVMELAFAPSAGILGAVTTAIGHDIVFRGALIASFVGSVGTGIWLSVQSEEPSAAQLEPPAPMLQGKKSLSLRLYVIRWHTQFGQEFASSDKTNLRAYLEDLVDRVMSQRKYDGVELRRRLRTSFQTYVATYGTPASKADDDWKKNKVASVVAGKKKSDRQTAIDGLECGIWRGTSYDPDYVEFLVRNFDSLFID